MFRFDQISRKKKERIKLIRNADKISLDLLYVPACRIFLIKLRQYRNKNTFSVFLCIQTHM
jgi:hypothetical protein